MDVPPTDVPPDDDSDGRTTESPTLCPEGLAECDGECFDLTKSNDHCGRCGNACENPFGAGPCDAGQCPPNSLCGPSTDFETCTDVCEAAGQTCLDEGAPWCQGVYQLYYPDNGVEKCEVGLGGGRNQEATCSDQIDWTLVGGIGLVLPVAVACCCTSL